MKNYHDFAANSKYFSTDNENEQVEEVLEKQKKFALWAQEFSKKIVVVIFLLYLAMSVVNVIFVYLSYKLGSMSGIDTLISEVNLTFREIIGGYIVKSAVENASKIIGNYTVGVIDAKLNAAREEREFEADEEFSDE